MAKRTNGEGTVRQRPNGQWEARISYRGDDDKIVRRSFYGKTAADARRKMREALKRVEQDLPPVDATATLATWIDQWQASILKVSSRKPATKQLYELLARLHLKPAPFGALTLAEVRPRHIDALVLHLREDKHLSGSTIRSTYTVLRSILDGAKRDALIAQNPAERVPRPTVAQHEARHLSPAEVRRLLTAAEPSRYHAALALIAATGLRRGEALGLAWDDLELDKPVLHVRQTLGRVGHELQLSTPKTENSRRDVVLTPSVVALLRRHRKAQIVERLRAGDQWHDSGLVFATETGSGVDGRNLLRVLQAAAKNANIEGVGLHTLRHSAATAMLNAGIPLHVVSRILGHSSVSITGDIYGHIADTSQREAMDSLSAALGL